MFLFFRPFQPQNVLILFLSSVFSNGPKCGYTVLYFFYCNMCLYYTLYWNYLSHASYSDGQRTCAYQYMYTVHEVFIVHTHRCNLLLFTYEKCANEV